MRPWATPPALLHSWRVATTSRMRSVSGSTSSSAPVPRFGAPLDAEGAVDQLEGELDRAAGAGADQRGAELVDGHPDLLDRGEVELTERRHAARDEAQDAQQPGIGRELEPQRRLRRRRSRLTRPRAGRRRPRTCSASPVISSTRVTMSERGPISRRLPASPTSRPDATSAPMADESRKVTPLRSRRDASGCPWRPTMASVSVGRGGHVELALDPDRRRGRPRARRSRR